MTEEQNAARKQSAALRSKIQEGAQDLKRGFGTINLYETKFSANSGSTQYQWKATDITCWTLGQSLT